MKMFRANIPGFCGYGCIGYGLTITEALKLCKKAYEHLAEKSGHNKNNSQSYGTFERAWDYFCGTVEIMNSGSWAVEGDEEAMDYEDVQILINTL